MAERQILCNPVDICRVHQLGRAQGASTLGAFGGQQVALSRPGPHHFACACDLKTFGYRFPSFDAFRTSHKLSLSHLSKEREL